MTNIRQLLADNIRENRKKLGLSQAKLAEKADLSTQYLAMIELSRKFPTPERLEQIARALEIDTPELFSMPPSVRGAALKLQKEILNDLDQAVSETVMNAVKTAVSKVVAVKLGDLKKEKSKSGTFSRTIRS